MSEELQDKTEGDSNKKQYRVIQKGVNQTRRVVIEVTGSDIHIAECDCQPLELFEVCRRIMRKVGGD